MGALAGILNYSKMAGQSLPTTSATPQASPAAAASGAGTTSGTDSSSASNSATISANDFLSLLVTEMQNQDPTANTDPNEYINQLVQVNSLEQLIDINQNLSTALGSSATTPGTTPSTQATATASSLTGKSPAGTTSAATTTVQKSAQPAPSVSSSAAHAASLQHAAGNLGVPDGKPAAQRVAHSLDGHSAASLKHSGFPLNR